RMAAREAAKREPGALDGTVALDRLHRVFRTARQEPALAADQPRQRQLIGADQAAQEMGERAHAAASPGADFALSAACSRRGRCSGRRTSPRSRSKPRLAVAARAIRT